MPDLDEVPALALEREALWKRLSEASFLTDDEKRAATGYEPLPVSLAPASLATQLAKYDPNQPRVPAGNPDGGQWTSGGGAGSNEDPDTSVTVIPVADGDPDKRYSVDLEEEDARGGHGRRDHVAKTDEELLDVLRKDWERRSNAQYEVTVFRPAEGSFESSLQANDLVNQTLRLHKDTVDLVASGQLEGATLNHRFGYITGKEAFRPNGDAKPYIRSTYGVIVVIRHDPRWARGYRVHTAYPTNRK